jgi:hypothetical protein
MRKLLGQSSVGRAAVVCSSLYRTKKKARSPGAGLLVVALRCACLLNPPSTHLRNLLVLACSMVRHSHSKKPLSQAAKCA